MKYYKNLSSLERRKVALGSSAFDAAMEGMDGARDACLKELRELEREKPRTKADGGGGDLGHRIKTL